MVLNRVLGERSLSVPHEAFQRAGFKSLNERGSSDLPDRPQTQISLHERPNEIPYLLHFLFARCASECVVCVEHLKDRIRTSSHGTSSSSSDTRLSTASVQRE